jgi:hypothetical protein
MDEWLSVYLQNCYCVNISVNRSSEPSEHRVCKKYIRGSVQRNTVFLKCQPTERISIECSVRE